MRKRTTEGDTDIAEKLNMGMILVLGIVCIISSIAVIVYSVILVILRHQSLMQLLTTLIFTSVLLAVGLGSVYLFRHMRRTQEEKKNFWKL